MRALAFIFAAASLLVACDAPPAPAPPAPGPERLVTLGGAVTEAVFALGRGPEVVAADLSSTWPPEVLGLPRLDYYRKLSAEPILALRPTRVLAMDDAGPEAVLGQLRAAGVTVELISARQDVPGARARIEALGGALGRQDQARALVATLDKDLGDLQNELQAQPPGPRALFLYARGARTLLVAGHNTGAHAMIELAGARNALEGVEGFKPLTAEGVIGANPDVIIIPNLGLDSVGGEEAVWALPGLAQTAAGRRRALVALDDQRLLGFGPRLGEAARELHQALQRAPQAQP
jgi:iron complex transport system substrate-binding protein